MRTFILVSFFLAGCDIEPCDPGQIKVQNASCVPDMPPSSSDGSPSDGGPSGEPEEAPKAAGSGATNCSPSSQFGDACVDSADCRCLTNYCAIPSGEVMGSCTHSGFSEDSRVCPAGFQCMVLSNSDLSGPSICVPPT
jgi:hypothetical protein